MQYQVLWLWLQNKSPVSSLLNISSTNYYYRAFPGDVVVKNQPVNAGDAGDLGSIFGLGRSPGIGNGNPIQYSCLDNSMDRGTWWVTVHGVAKSMTWLSTHTHTHTHKYHYNPIHNSKWIQFSHSVVSDSLWPHGLQHARFPCPSPTSGAYSNSCPLTQWCHPTISFSVIPFSSCLWSFPASRSFQMSQFFTSGGQSIGVSASASVLPMNIQDWFPLGCTAWISLRSKGLSRVFSMYC